LSRLQAGEDIKIGPDHKILAKLLQNPAPRRFPHGKLLCGVQLFEPKHR
jgi:hypothetical protein